MRELNYVEGHNLLVSRAFADGNADRLPDLVADLVQAKVDVIVATSTLETLAAKRATTPIPIVMTVAPNPVGDGLVAGLARPGGNVTGLTSMIPGISQKYVQLLHELLPSASRFAVVGGPGTPTPEIRRELQISGQQASVTLSFAEIEASNDIAPVLEREKMEGSVGIIAAFGAVTYGYRTHLVQLALKLRLPGIYWHRDFVEAGGLMSYGANSRDVGRRAAYFVDRILHGAKPADLPVEQPTTFELVINLNAAKSLGITVPQSLLLRADDVIQ
jgi:putative ABC transport system substrate-binding protein